MLENHHKRLAEILRFQHEHPPKTLPEKKLELPTFQTTKSEPNDPKIPPLTTPPRQDSLPIGAVTPGFTSRSSRNAPNPITSNLATARGIPSLPSRGIPASPAVSVRNVDAKIARSKQDWSDQRDMLSLEIKRRHNRAAGQRSSLPTNTESDAKTAKPVSQESSRLQAVNTATSAPHLDEPFQRFYSVFEGLISKISAPLAFASLPLVSDTFQRQKAHKPSAEIKVDRRSAVPDFSGISQKLPDVSKLVSSAALRALRDKNGPAQSYNPAESFYVVPTAGGTISYAGILKDTQKQQFSDNDEEFVDAREVPVSPDGSFHNLSAQTEAKNAGRKRGTKTLEELQLENQTLKHLADTLANRLHMWEMNSQSSSIALHQSLRATFSQTPKRSLSPAASPTAAPSTAISQPDTPGYLHSTSAPNIDARLRDLEARLKHSEKEADRFNRENAKLKDVVCRYRDRWEKLKESARVRREGAKDASDGSKVDSPTRSPATRPENIKSSDADSEEDTESKASVHSESRSDEDRNKRGLMDE